MTQPVDGPQGNPYEFLRRILSTNQTYQDVLLNSVGLDAEALAKLQDRYPRVAECIGIVYILSRIDRSDSLPTFLEHGISDVWFPFPKHTLRHCLKDNNSEKKFLDVQTELVRQHWPNHTDKPVPHLIFDDGDEIVKSARILGEGGFAIVEEVTLPTKPLSTVCVRKRISRPRQFRAQKPIMEAFVREIKIMSLVAHHHCVQFLGSYTDHDSLAILSLPIADMDLATYLNLDSLDQEQYKVISRGMGCLCNALHYLHQRKIRHEDLKPQNVLIHGEKILLTDFGFSLDFSNDSISTTTGRPTHWTPRYTAPETLEFAARNRATDVWSLGCILVEMFSRLHGHRLSEITKFWMRTGNRHPSFSMNNEATTGWLDALLHEIDSGNKALILYKFIRTMLQTDRLLRPSTQQIVDKIHDLELVFPVDPPFTDNCCKSRELDPDEEHRINSLTKFPGYLYPDVLDSHTFLLVDRDGVAFGFKDNWPMDKSKGQPLDTYFASPNNLKNICERLWKRNALSAQEGKRTVRQLAIRSHRDGEFLACLSVLANSFNKLSIERTMCKIKLPWSSFENRLRLVHVAIMPICFPRSELHECYFFIISFNSDDVQSRAQEEREAEEEWFANEEGREVEEQWFAEMEDTEGDEEAVAFEEEQKAIDRWYADKEEREVEEQRFAEEEEEREAEVRGEEWLMENENKTAEEQWFAEEEDREAEARGLQWLKYNQEQTAEEQQFAEEEEREARARREQRLMENKNQTAEEQWFAEEEDREAEARGEKRLKYNEEQTAEEQRFAEEEDQEAEARGKQWLMENEEQMAEEQWFAEREESRG